MESRKNENMTLWKRKKMGSMCPRENKGKEQHLCTSPARRGVISGEALWEAVTSGRKAKGWKEATSWGP